MNKQATVVSISDLVFDELLDVRGTIDSVVVADYASALESGSNFPPIRVEKDTLRIIDGRHRATAFRKVGRKKISAYLETAADEHELFLMAVEANSTNSLRYSELQKQRILFKAQQLGIEERRALVALRLPLNRAKPIRVARFREQQVVLKNVAAHLDGKEMTSDQYEVHKSFPGQRQADVFHNVKRIIETDLTDWKNGVVVRQLIALQNLLTRRLSEMGYGAELAKPSRIGLPQDPSINQLNALREEANKALGSH